MKKGKILGVLALAAIFISANGKEKVKKSTKVIYADVTEPLVEDRTPDGAGGTGTPI